MAASLAAEEIRPVSAASLDLEQLQGLKKECLRCQAVDDGWEVISSGVLLSTKIPISSKEEYITIDHCVILLDHLRQTWGKLKEVQEQIEKAMPEKKTTEYHSFYKDVERCLQISSNGSIPAYAQIFKPSHQIKALTTAVEYTVLALSIEIGKLNALSPERKQFKALSPRESCSSSPLISSAYPEADGVAPEQEQESQVGLIQPRDKDDIGVGEVKVEFEPEPEPEAEEIVEPEVEFEDDESETESEVEDEGEVEPDAEVRHSYRTRVLAC